jgi:hypothetical protein
MRRVPPHTHYPKGGSLSKPSNPFVCSSTMAQPTAIMNTIAASIFRSDLLLVDTGCHVCHLTAHITDEPIGFSSLHPLRNIMFGLANSGTASSVWRDPEEDIGFGMRFGIDRPTSVARSPGG